MRKHWCVKAIPTPTIPEVDAWRGCCPECGHPKATYGVEGVSPRGVVELLCHTVKRHWDHVGLLQCRLGGRRRVVFRREHNTPKGECDEHPACVPSEVHPAPSLRVPPSIGLFCNGHPPSDEASPLFIGYPRVPND